MSPIPGFWAVIPAGGAGTRLWPLSRAASPKFLHDLTGTGRTLIQATVERLTPLAADRIMIVTGAAHRDAVLAQLPDLVADQIVAEPSARDSMAAIGLAAALLEHRDPDAVLGSFAADHVIVDTDAFERCVRLAAEVAGDGPIVTIGVEPTYPSSGLGYIQRGAELPGHHGAFAVRRFVEKPSAELAAQYLATGQFRWNAGIFVVRAGTLLDLLARWHPQLAAGLRAIAAGQVELAEAWPTLERIAIDHAVAEPAADAGQVAMVPGAFGWDDVGDFASLGALLTPDEAGVRVLGEPKLVRAQEASGLVVPASGRTVTVVGLADVVVVDTPDALLVTSREHAQQVKKLVDGLRADGRTELL